MSQDHHPALTSAGSGSDRILRGVCHQDRQVEVGRNAEGGRSVYLLLPLLMQRRQANPEQGGVSSQDTSNCTCGCTQQAAHRVRHHYRQWAGQACPTHHGCTPLPSTLLVPPKPFTGTLHMGPRASLTHSLTHLVLPGNLGCNCLPIFGERRLVIETVSDDRWAGGWARCRAWGRGGRGRRAALYVTT
jgi:hypothetical protein